MKRYQKLLCGWMILASLLFPLLGQQFNLLRLSFLSPLRSVSAYVNATTTDQTTELRLLRGKLALAYSQILDLRKQVDALSGFRRKFAQHPKVIPAKIILRRESSNFRQMVLINRGSRDGIATGFAVAFGDALVGVIKQAGEWVSWVSLITDPAVKLKTLLVSAQDGTCYAKGIVVGTGDAKSCWLKFISCNHRVRAGDLLLTTEFGDIGPQGLVIGEVLPSVELNYGMFHGAKIRPLVDLDQLNVVLVVVK